MDGSGDDIISPGTNKPIHYSAWLFVIILVTYIGDESIIQVTTSYDNIRCVFLDRDGVINRKPAEDAYVGSWSDFHILPGAESAIAALNHAGCRVIVISNQRGIALGHYTAADVEALHLRLQQHLAEHEARIDAFYYCPHDKDQCDCRKPKIGLFEQAFHDFPNISRATSIMIGDSLSDIKAARTLGLPSIFIQGDPETRKPGAALAAEEASLVVDSLAEAVEFVLAHRRPGTR